MSTYIPTRRTEAAMVRAGDTAAQMGVPPGTLLEKTLLDALQGPVESLSAKTRAQVLALGFRDAGEKYDTSPIGKPGGRQNWVDKAGGLPLYIRAIAHALIRNGHSTSRAISIAVGTVKRWARGGGNVTAKTRAKAAKAVAEWEAKKAAGKKSGDAVDYLHHETDYAVDDWDDIFDDLTKRQDEFDDIDEKSAHDSSDFLPCSRCGSSKVSFPPGKQPRCAACQFHVRLKDSAREEKAKKKPSLNGNYTPEQNLARGENALEASSGRDPRRVTARGRVRTGQRVIRTAEGARRYGGKIGDIIQNGKVVGHTDEQQTNSVDKRGTSELIERAQIAKTGTASSGKKGRKGKSTLKSAPTTSPNDSELEEFKNGRAKYKDGSVYTSDGWVTPPKQSPSGAKAVQVREDGSVIYEDGQVFNPATGRITLPEDTSYIKKVSNGVVQTKALLLSSKLTDIAMEFKGVVRHVRTPAGVARYKLPIGSIIGSRGKFKFLSGDIPDAYEEYTRVKSPRGFAYDIGKEDDGKYRAYDAADTGGKDPLFEESDQEKAYERLDKIAKQDDEDDLKAEKEEQAAAAAAKKPKPAPKPAAKKPATPKKTVSNAPRDSPEGAYDALTPNGQAFMAMVGAQEFDFFDDGMVEGSGNWGKHMAWQAASRLGISRSSMGGIMSRMSTQEYPLWNVRDYDSDEKDRWWDLTALGAEVAKLAAKKRDGEKPAPEPEKPKPVAKAPEPKAPTVTPKPASTAERVKPSSGLTADDFKRGDWVTIGNGPNANPHTVERVNPDGTLELRPEKYPQKRKTNVPADEVFKMKFGSNPDPVDRKPKDKSRGEIRASRLRMGDRFTMDYATDRSAAGDEHVVTKIDVDSSRRPGYRDATYTITNQDGERIELDATERVNIHNRAGYMEEPSFPKGDDIRDVQSLSDRELMEAIDDDWYEFQRDVEAEGDVRPLTAADEERYKKPYTEEIENRRLVPLDDMGHSDEFEASEGQHAGRIFRIEEREGRPVAIDIRNDDEYPFDEAEFGPYVRRMTNQNDPGDTIPLFGDGAPEPDPEPKPEKSPAVQGPITGADAWKRRSKGKYSVETEWGTYTIDGNNAGRNRWTVNYPGGDYGMTDSFAEARAWAEEDRMERVGRTASPNVPMTPRGIPVPTPKPAPAASAPQAPSRAVNAPVRVPNRGNPTPQMQVMADELSRKKNNPRAFASPDSRLAVGRLSTALRSGEYEDTLAMVRRIEALELLAKAPANFPSFDALRKIREVVEAARDAHYQRLVREREEYEARQR